MAERPGGQRLMPLARPFRLPPAWAAVAAAVVWNLVTLRSALTPVAYLDDSSVHQQMVRVATGLLSAGHDPLTSWFPYLSEGSPQFLHYQSLPSLITALPGLLVGGDVAFRWSLYLLLSLWPVSVYVTARIFGAPSAAAAVSAVLAPFVLSTVGVGYEVRAYIWLGYGVWAQLWASLFLGPAWATAWRAIRTGQGIGVAALLMGVTVALHYETGYLALAPLVLWPLAAPRPWRSALRRTAPIVIGALALCAWEVVPVITQSAWAARNEVLQHTSLTDGYGLPRVLGWLAGGGLLDSGRLPVITLLAGVGLVITVRAARREAAARGILVALGASLLLSGGRRSFGPLADVIPGSGDIFFRRFTMGVQLAALLLAGRGGWCVGNALWSLLRDSRVGRRPAATLLALGGALVLLGPAIQLAGLTADNARAVAAQRRAELRGRPQIDGLVAQARAGGGGRLYAGLLSNWGARFTVGSVPVFKYLESRDVDAVGYTLRSAALMENPEYHFDERQPGDYALFGIGYLLLPPGHAAPVPARLTRCAGVYCLWSLPRAGYLQAGSVVARVGADRTNLGQRSVPLLHSALAAHGLFVQVDFGRSEPVSPVFFPGARAPAAPAAVLRQRVNLAAGRAGAQVQMASAGAVVLSASFDPGWRATVDGSPAPTVMVAPALVAAGVPAGRHQVSFVYSGYGGYPWLFLLSGLALLVLLSPARVRRATKRRLLRPETDPRPARSAPE